MPPLEVVERNQIAVLWPVVLLPNGLPRVDRRGQPMVAAKSITLDPAKQQGVRWVWKRSERVDAKGNTVTLDATAVVDREVKPQSLMWLGNPNALPTAGTPIIDQPQGLCYVATYNETANIKNRSTRRTVGLVRFRGALPAQA